MLISLCNSFYFSVSKNTVTEICQGTFIILHFVVALFKKSKQKTIVLIIHLFHPIYQKYYHFNMWHEAYFTLYGQCTPDTITSWKIINLVNTLTNVGANSL